MTAENYKSERKQRGTQTAVATLLGVTQVTIARRETGVSPITKETFLALLALLKKRKKSRNEKDA